MTNTTYTTRTEAIEALIVAPIAAGFGDSEDETAQEAAYRHFNVDAIADDLIEGVATPRGYGFREVADADFWALVEAAAH